VLDFMRGPAKRPLCRASTLRDGDIPDDLDDAEAE
jgi:hypothetical protein